MTDYNGGDANPPPQKNTAYIPPPVSIKKMLLWIGISLLCYVFVWDLWFALGFIGLLFIHEMGHFVIFRRYKIPVTLPIFIPFLGAAVRISDIEDPETEAFGGLGGPLIGGLAAMLLLLPWEYLLVNKTLQDLASTGLVINLFNLVPVLPLDGGRVLQVLGKKVAVFRNLAMLLIFITFIQTQHLILLLILVFGWFGRIETRGEKHAALVEALPLRVKLLWVFIYLGLGFALACGLRAVFIVAST